jgi:hypothetical protein
MIHAEASVAQRIRTIFGDKVIVVVGPRTPSSTAWAKPEIYVQLSRFDDWEGVSVEGARTARRPLPDSTPGYAEERPGRIVLEIEVCASAYAHVQGIRETLVAPMLSHLESIDAMTVSAAARTKIVFRDFVPVLDQFAVVLHADGDGVLYSGRIRFNFDGFMHVRVSDENSGDRPTSVRKKAKKRTTKAKAVKKRKSKVRKKI